MNPRINPAGVVDLSQLAPKPPAPAGSSYVMEADEASFDEVMHRSLKHLIVLELHSPRANADAMSAELATAANSADGAWLLVRVDVDANPRIAQALQVTAVPAVFGVVGGQLAPLWQGTRDAAEIRMLLDQLVSLAAQNGITGRAEPVGPPAGEESAPDPRFAAADEAIARGDYAAAEAEFERLLEANPADAEARAGKAQMGLLVRTASADPATAMAAAEANPDDVDAQLLAADLEVAGGSGERGFARLIEMVRSNPVGRDRAKARLLELFECVGGTDPTVLSARRDLTSALF